MQQDRVKGNKGGKAKPLCERSGDTVEAEMRK